jgi:NSS family neurotransmitter:Na+ symporter
MAISRGGFSSRFGFIMAAAGSAVGLGNIWGFPTQTASNGGAAFVLVYLVLAFCLAYPAFMAELLIGRHGQANAVTSLKRIANNQWEKRFGFMVGFGGIICAALILSFYAIVAGWMMAYTVQPVANLVGLTDVAQWSVTSSTSRDVFFTVAFSLLTIGIIRQGVQEGIENWSKRLMPVLFLLLIGLIAYVLTLDGAITGLKAYLLPDFSRVFEPDLMVSALGQAFFSLSLGTSVMIIYGSYISHKENLVTLGAQVTLIDVSVAFLAGLLILPAMYVAQHQGVEIFAANGDLISGDQLVFQVLPSLFAGMETMGNLIAFGFFALMTIAALTSSISMLEGPVSYVVEVYEADRHKTTTIVGLLILAISLLIIFNFELLFGLVIALTTQYGQPLIGMLCCVFVGWIWHRDSILKELQQGAPDIAQSWFWKIWPWYVKFICPVAIGAVFLNSLGLF